METVALESVWEENSHLLPIIPWKWLGPIQLLGPVPHVCESVTPPLRTPLPNLAAELVLEWERATWDRTAALDYCGWIGKPGMYCFAGASAVLGCAFPPDGAGRRRGFVFRLYDARQPLLHNMITGETTEPFCGS